MKKLVKTFFALLALGIILIWFSYSIVNSEVDAIKWIEESNGSIWILFSICFITSAFISLYLNDFEEQ